VDLFTGRFVTHKTDLVLPGRIPVRIERTYWSGLSRQGFFGVGWNLGTYDARLTTRGTSLLLIQADQSQLLFAPDGPDRWVNRTAPYMAGAVITRRPGEFHFQLRFKDGRLQHFDRIVGFSNLAGLVAIIDRNGNTVTVVRSSPAPGLFGLITRIIEPAGRRLDLTYDGAGRITHITDPIDREVRYTYDVQGRLETVTDAAGPSLPIWVRQ
jgi:YD repeat-containing protein